MEDLRIKLLMATDEELRRAIAGCYLSTDGLWRFRNAHLLGVAQDVDMKIKQAAINELEKRENDH